MPSERRRADRFQSVPGRFTKLRGHRGEGGAGLYKATTPDGLDRFSKHVVPPLTLGIVTWAVPAAMTRSPGLRSPGRFRFGLEAVGVGLQR